ncbi:transporter [Methanobrevibacter sp. 87.7]|uniref:DUF2162 domain-containing protein n=1 Tax=Methanobrevibacter sp. 87.7 TaxID=387957 RepID=UPI000B677938|nr:DUF2162 domain-containing protein [Methanobrevibacter sp. 87.7]OWT33352.1 transporter [Methanobrevibacter sp. 87.7]
MNGMSVLLQFGILAAVLVFGVKVGLASGLSHMPKKWLALIDILYFGGIMVISYICQPFATQITSIVYGFNTWFYLIMACIMIAAGVLTIREFKVHGKNTSKPAAIAIIAPCPCCFGAIIASILVVTPMVGISMMNLSWLVAIAMVAVITITYFIADVVIKVLNTPYPIILGDFMFFIGLYFLLSPLIIPNVTAVMKKSLGGITISSLTSLIYVIIVAIVLLILGALYTRKNEDF